MYILVKETIPLGIAINSVAHGAMSAYLAFREVPIFTDWLTYSFKKVTCKVTENQFELAKQHGRHIVVTESNLAKQEVALVFCPQQEWPTFFKELSLYK